ncbi:efflux RND transporter permease subunit [Oceanimonas baumannii]|uniref:HAE1 family hydrophobic/amphiphilic exporter-1 n=1 Tax=Oceanimonas baumannii TaxID=129578 RepID=A0A235CPC8_9GAMM|nr:efflux RND transporter permease subunit [Oceanimonas baumannii]OYD25857.1 multidrug transporter AcrB [Oceanimonas baumannii]TDW60127.1 HAE1 family hydrophobic/amphiphilic exporter-1 [Oceanimonas baumannii]
MRLSDIAIARPVLATVLSLMLCVFGLIAFFELPLREMPDTTSPIVTVRTDYTGASASVMESQVTKRLEDELSGISGVKFISSATSDGRSSITVEFNPERDLDNAASDVREAVSRASRQLPDDADAPVVTKDTGRNDVILWVTLRSTGMSALELGDYAENVLADRFSLLDGVSSVWVGGRKERVMNVRLNTAAMAVRGVTVADIAAALRSQNVELPAGTLENDQQNFAARIERGYNSAADFNNLAIRNLGSGERIYLRDVAEIWEGEKPEDTLFRSNGQSVVGLGIVKQTQANTLEVIDEVKRAVQAQQPFLPDNTELTWTYDSSVFIESAIDEVYQTLMITMALVVLVIYLFLGQVRATLIPAVTVPVSLISAFIVAMIMGFSVNLITLMALIMAIGLVVDDAIVVLENIHHHLERGRSPLAAAWHGTREVGFAVIATTLTLISVFLPIVFMGGIIGRIFTEFAVLLAAAVGFSSLVALTLSPVMAEKLLKPAQSPSRLARYFDGAFARLETGYRRLLVRELRHGWWAPLVMVAALGVIAVLFREVPQSLTPEEDRGVVIVLVKGAEGASFERMSQAMGEVESSLMPLREEGIISSLTVRTPGFGGGVNSGIMFASLSGWDERSVSSAVVAGRIRALTRHVTEVLVIPILPSSIRSGSSTPVEFVLGGADYDQLLEWAEQLRTLARDNPGLSDLELDFDRTKPELLVQVDKQRAASLGISVTEVADSLNVMLGGQAMTTYSRQGEEYDVFLKGDENDFGRLDDLASLYLRTNGGDLVSLDNLVSLQEQGAPGSLNHYNRKKAITLSANLEGSYSLGEALDYLDGLVRDNLPDAATVDYKGESLEYRSNQSDVAFVFGLALVVVFLILAAQFESFVHPFIVLLTVPLGLLGGLLGLYFSGITLNAYSQIAMVMLIGLVTKNGILIVEFANQLRDKGLEFDEALTEAAVRRLRPILMTAFTTVAGAVPLILASGAGAESRQSVGMVVFGGVALATLLTLFIVPAMYRMLARHTRSPEHQQRRLDAVLHESD